MKSGGRLVTPTTSPDETVAKARGVWVTIMYVKPYAAPPGGGAGRRSRRRQVVFDMSLPFETFGNAIERQMSGRARGKIVITQP
jgi:hypothetical protein